jgi:ribonuclease BN (tRNA processing enzyme)
MNMEIVFLGTSSIQIGDKFCTSFLVRNGEELLLFETGPGVVSQLSKLNIHYSQINNIVISHAHFDHFLELPYLLFLRFVMQISKGLSLPKIQLISTHQVFELTSYVFQSCYPKISLQSLVEFFEAHPSKPSSFNLGSFKITTIPVTHTLPAIACKIEVDKKTLVYSGDTIYDESLVDLSKGADVLIYEAFSTSFHPTLVKVAKAGLHGTAYEAGLTAKRAGVKKLVLVHSDPEVKKEDLVLDAQRNFEGEIYVPKEFERIII